MALFAQNNKLSKSSTDKYLAINFGIPAYKSADGFRTCPMAGVCASGCYAQAAAYTWPVVRAAYEARLAATLRDDFTNVASADLTRWVRRASRTGRQLVVRIHDSGDFYSPAYLQKWLAIAARFPNVRFYAYTKMITLAKRASPLVPSNFRLIQSEGGLEDGRINQAAWHSRVFASREDLIAAGYADASQDDLVAAFGDSPRIGLVYHGVKSKAWQTAV